MKHILIMKQWYVAFALRNFKMIVTNVPTLGLIYGEWQNKQYCFSGCDMHNTF